MYVIYSYEANILTFFTDLATVIWVDVALNGENVRRDTIYFFVSSYRGKKKKKKWSFNLQEKKIRDINLVNSLNPINTAYLILS